MTRYTRYAGNVQGVCLWCIHVGTIQPYPTHQTDFLNPLEAQLENTNKIQRATLLDTQLLSNQSDAHRWIRWPWPTMANHGEAAGHLQVHGGELGFRVCGVCQDPSRRVLSVRSPAGCRGFVCCWWKEDVAEWKLMNLGQRVRVPSTDTSSDIPSANFPDHLMISSIQLN